ncbi:MAG: spore germination protein [Clostridiaceae bacterium]
MTTFENIKKYIKYTRMTQSSRRLKYYANKYTGDIFKIDKNLDINFNNIKAILGKSDDISFKEFKIGIRTQTKAFICVVDGLIDRNKVEKYIETISLYDKNICNDNEEILNADIFTLLKDNLLNSAQLSEARSFNKIIGDILSGCMAVYIDGYDVVFIININETAERGVEPPNTETTIRGSREGFVENISVNVSLLRKIIKNHNLVIRSSTLGSKTHTRIAIAYIEGIAEASLVKEVEKKINKISLDAILESGYIEQAIGDHPVSIFSTVGNSEKPDKVASKLLEGRVAILCNGTPFVLTVPYLFVEAFQSTEDYYSKPFLSSFLRILRLGAFFITVITPAFYVALVSFNQEMLPTVLLMSFAGALENVPFPIFFEAFFMIIIFELIKESGLRMPKPIGQAVSIVGALIIGQAAVDAGIIGAPMVIIIALTGITGFIVTPLIDAVVFLRFFLLFLSGIFGLFGFIIGVFFIVGHVCSLKSFGVPYLTPIAPAVLSGLNDSFIRMPLRFLNLKSQTGNSNDNKGSGGA